MSSDSLIHAVAGAGGGMFAMLLTYPLVTLSTRAAVETRQDERSMKEIVLDIIKREGVSGLYAGVNSSMIGIAVTNGVYYYFYERTRAGILSTRTGGTKALSTLEAMLTGLIAGSATTIISNPVWVIQTTQAVNGSATSRNHDTESGAAKPKQLSFRETIQLIIRKDGIGAFWRGLGPALVLVANPIIQYTVFEQLKNFVVRRRAARMHASGSTAAATLKDLDFFLLGALSKLVATASTYPYIVIKSRMQAGTASAQKYKSALDGLLSVLRQEGVAGLYKGVASKLLQSVITAAILFASQRRLYELTKASIAGGKA
ncbi:mitochondrial carrier [Auriculariales sp. MPI-PUGE-AT-0066]|nr:mitochondrial carrier [Auriculariales sp. MPI-PUGE-AT-0066]